MRFWNSNTESKFFLQTHNYNQSELYTAYKLHNDLLQDSMPPQRIVYHESISRNRTCTGKWNEVLEKKQEIKKENIRWPASFPASATPADLRYL